MADKIKLCVAEVRQAVQDATSHIESCKAEEADHLSKDLAVKLKALKDMIEERRDSSDESSKLQVEEQRVATIRDSILGLLTRSDQTSIFR
mmetsp:Transcript_29926/g.53132  ORF Transcript_29926/g.53132 Transcript_29926/m.53132 type:complete len:91 (+) Transcript_29926:708-980(+)